MCVCSNLTNTQQGHRVEVIYIWHIVPIPILSTPCDIFIKETNELSPSCFVTKNVGLVFCQVRQQSSTPARQPQIGAILVQSNAAGSGWQSNKMAPLGAGQVAQAASHVTRTKTISTISRIYFNTTFAKLLSYFAGKTHTRTRVVAPCLHMNSCSVHSVCFWLHHCKQLLDYLEKHKAYIVNIYYLS